MAETTADVRRDIELTRMRMSNTIAELERKLNVLEVVRDHPWPAIAVAAGAGFLLAGTGADMKAARAAAATTAATTKGATGRIAPMIDDLVSRVFGGVHEALGQRADVLVDELRRAIVGPAAGPARAAAVTTAAVGYGGSTRDQQLSVDGREPGVGGVRPAVPRAD